MTRNKELFKGELSPVYQPKKPNKLVGHRLELYRRHLKMRGYDFARHLSISQGSYSDLKNNKSLPSCQTIINIIERGECDIIWLLTGKK